MEKSLLDPEKELLVSIVLKQVMGALSSKLPWLSWGPASAIVSFFLKKILRVILDKTILGINLALIKVENFGDVNRFNDAMKRAINSESEEEKELARNEVIEAASSLIKLNNAKLL